MCFHTAWRQLTVLDDVAVISAPAYCADALKPLQDQISLIGGYLCTVRGADARELSYFENSPFRTDVREESAKVSDDVQGDAVLVSALLLSGPAYLYKAIGVAFKSRKWS
jgi:hypothetical protein